MSHLRTLVTQMVDDQLVAAALEKACSEMHVTLERNAMLKAYYESQNQVCPFVIRASELGSRVDVGLVKKGGKWDWVMDESMDAHKPKVQQLVQSTAEIHAIYDGVSNIREAFPNARGRTEMQNIGYTVVDGKMQEIPGRSIQVVIEVDDDEFTLA